MDGLNGAKAAKNSAMNLNVERNNKGAMNAAKAPRHNNWLSASQDPEASPNAMNNSFKANNKKNNKKNNNKPNNSQRSFTAVNMGFGSVTNTVGSVGKGAVNVVSGVGSAAVSYTHLTLPTKRIV